MQGHSKLLESDMAKVYIPYCMDKHTAARWAWDMHAFHGKFCKLDARRSLLKLSLAKCALVDFVIVFYPCSLHIACNLHSISSCKYGMCQQACPCHKDCKITSVVLEEQDCDSLDDHIE